MEVKGRRGRRRKKLLDGLKDRRGYSHLKEEVLDRTMWRNRFRGGFGPVVRQNTKWMNYGNTAVDLDPLPVVRARLTVVEPALFEWEVFEMAAPIQSPAKCKVRFVIRFLNAKGERTGRRWVSGLHCDWRWNTGFSPHSWIQVSWEEVWRWWWGARRSLDMVQRAGGRLLWLGDTEAGSET
jgi:hypothetical protein